MKKLFSLLLFLTVLGITACKKEEPIVKVDPPYPYFISKVTVERVDSIPHGWFVSLNQKCGTCESIGSHVSYDYTIDQNFDIYWGKCEGQGDTLRVEVTLTEWQDQQNFNVLGHVTLQRGDTSLYYIATSL